MVAADPKDNKRLDVLIVADNFNQELRSLSNKTPLGLFNVASFSLLDLTLEWVSRIDANVYIAISKIDNSIAEEIKNKWKPYINVSILQIGACNSFGDVMRAVDKLHLLTKEFILIENLPTFCSSKLTSNLEAFKELRKDRTVDGQKILGKDSLMSMICTRSKSKNNLFLLENSTKRLLLYNPEKGISLTKKQFAAKCVVYSDLKLTGIYLCAPEIITKFSDNIDAQTFNEQIGNILAQDETICEYIYVDILPENVFADSGSDYDSVFGCLYSFLHQKYYPTDFTSLHPNVANWEKSVVLQYREDFVFVPLKYEAPIGTNNTVFGGPFTVGEKTSISGCFFDVGISIGSGSSISHAIVGKNVKIGKDVRIERSIICDDVVIGDNSVISNCIMIDSKTKISIKTEAKKEKHNEMLRSSSPDAELSVWPEKIEYIKSNINNRKSQENKRQKSAPVPASTGKIAEVTYELASEGLKSFDEEVRESMKNALDSDDWSGKERLKSLILEINSSKLAYNISMEDVAKHIFFAYLNQPKFGPTLDEMKKLTNGWKHIWTNYYKPAESKQQILHAIEEYVNFNLEWKKYAPNYILFLYNDVDILTDDIIVEWYEDLSKEHPLKNDDFNKLIEWLKDEDGDDSEEEED